MSKQAGDKALSPISLALLDPTASETVTCPVPKEPCEWVVVGVNVSVDAPQHHIKSHACSTATNVASTIRDIDIGLSGGRAEAGKRHVATVEENLEVFEQKLWVRWRPSTGYIGRFAEVSQKPISLAHSRRRPATSREHHTESREPVIVASTGLRRTASSSESPLSHSSSTEDNQGPSETQRLSPRRNATPAPRRALSAHTPSTRAGSSASPPCAVHAEE
ncbi:myosin-5 [Striga asiatica]|uniref:Myosin-5 n=1 Tax=Striga asiatica TaxID=4170 RepID=A0A5A7NXL7_STRAF|nr:myosin-5 [Striga asiatica]